MVWYNSIGASDVDDLIFGSDDQVIYSERSWVLRQKPHLLVWVFCFYKEILRNFLWHREPKRGSL